MEGATGSPVLTSSAIIYILVQWGLLPSKKAFNLKCKINKDKNIFQTFLTHSLTKSIASLFLL